MYGSNVIPVKISQSFNPITLFVRELSQKNREGEWLTWPVTVIIRSKVQVSLQLSQLVSLLKLGFKFHNKIQIKLHDKISKCEGFDNIILKFPSLTLLEPKKQILPLLCLFVYNITINPKSTGGGGGHVVFGW